MVSRPLIGIAVDGASGYGRAVMRGVMQYAQAERKWEFYTTLRRTFDAIPQKWPACEGAIVAGANLALIDAIREQSRHLVLCSRWANPIAEAFVQVDDVAIGAMAAEHLIECGLKSFGFYPSGIDDPRCAGFMKVVEQHGFRREMCPFMWHGHAEGVEHWRELIPWLRALPKPVGILTVDDKAAHDLAGACRHADLGVPEHVAIIGVNNDDLLCEAASIPITSVDCGYTRVGYAAAALLDRLMRGERLTARARHISLPPLQVVRRLSTDVLAVNDPVVADALRYIRQHACDPCTVKELLRQVPTGRRWLERQFVKKLGRSPGDEILRIQMEMAKRLLLQPALTLPDIAERCGFGSGPALGRAFLRHVGTSPAKFRRNALTPPN